MNLESGRRAKDDERLAMLAALVSGDRWRVCQSDYEPIECTK